MSIKKKRIGMLASLNNTLRDIEADAKNQTPAILASNMKILQAHVKDILALDGVGFINDEVKL
ncbi:hypothetical protein [Pseudoalteromonas sp. SaAl2]